MIHALAGLAFLGASLAASKWGMLVDLIERARAQGWTVERTSSGHWKFIPSDKTKKIVVGGGSGGDPRAWKNLEAQLKRSGLSGGGARYVRGGWDAARRAQQRHTTKSYKPGPFDHWTDEELYEKAMDLIMGTERSYQTGAWYDLDRGYSIANWNRSDAQTCYAVKSHIERAVSSISLAKRIYDTGRISRFAVGRIQQFQKDNEVIDFGMLADRVAEAIRAHDRNCAPYSGPTFP